MLRRYLALAGVFAALVTSLVASSVDAQTRLPVNITTTPAGATVFVDSTTTAAIGVTPLRRVSVPRGNHNFIFRLEGYQELTLPVNVTRYGQNITATLTQLARLQITASDDSAIGATVTIDGEARGTVPFSEWIRPDRVQVVVSREGYRNADQWVTLSPGQVFAWPVRLERDAPRTGTLVVTADLRGAPVFIDGTQRCQTPCTLADVPEGAHLVEIRPTQAGARPHSQQVTVVAGQAATVDAEIEMAPQTGTLRVLCQAPGALISVDGEPVGPSPAVRDGLAPGEHIVDVTAAGYQRSQQTVTITAGQQRVVSVELTPTAATTGMLRVVGSPAGATIAVDGAPRGVLPTTEGIPLEPGDHIVEVAMAGYVTSSQTVTIVAGQQRIASFTLAEVQREPGAIRITANVPGASVLIDGNGPFPVPYVLDHAPVGSHSITVRASGFSEFSRICTVGPGVDCAVEAQLEGARIQFRVQVQTDAVGAHVFVDGSDMGALPFSGTIPVGQHRIEVRADGFRDDARVVTVNEADPPLVLDVTLRRQNELTDEEIAEREAAREREIRRAFTRTGDPLPADLANVELLGGWPYLAEARLSMGIHEHVDLGLTFRTTGRLTEFMVRARAGYHPRSRYSIGGQVMLGGGIGPTRTSMGGEHKTNDFVLNADALISLHLSRAGAFTFNLGFDVTSDSWNWQLGDRDTLIPAPRIRQLTAHGRFGATLEVALSNQDTFMFTAQGLIGPSRRIMGDLFGIDGITYEDKMIGMHTILQVGWMHKFNWRDDEEL